MFLPAREVEPALANLGVQPGGPLVDLVRQAGQLQGVLDVGVAQVFALAIQRQVVAQGAAGNKGLLRAVGKLRAAAPTHGAGAGRVFRQQQAQQHGLAGTHRANDGQALTGLQIQRNIAQYGLVFCGAETQVVDVQGHRSVLSRLGGFGIFQIEIFQQAFGRHIGLRQDARHIAEHHKGKLQTLKNQQRGYQHGGIQRAPLPDVEAVSGSGHHQAGAREHQG